MARSQRGGFGSARRAEGFYARELRRIARTIRDIVQSGMDLAGIENALREYARLINPWARTTAARMLEDVSRRDFRSWLRHGRQIGEAIRARLESAPVGADYARLMEDNIGLITRMPLDTRERIHEMATEGLSRGQRWEDIAEEILNNGWRATQAQANVVARTETARAASIFQATRAQHLGSTHFQWMTANDADVRPLHRQIARNDVGYGRGVYRWDQPPELDDGRRGLPGSIYNCRCIAVPVPLSAPIEARPTGRSRLYEASLRPEAAPFEQRYRAGELSRTQYETALRRIASQAGIA